MRKTITDKEKTLINCYKDLAITVGWEQVTARVFENRDQYLSEEMSKHYTNLNKVGKLRDRIYYCVQQMKGKGTD
jgi:predicted transcriptional regulator of viral defense system